MDGSKQKLDEMLGIKGSIDDYLNELSINSSENSVSAAFEKIDENVKTAVAELDSGLKALETSADPKQDLVKVDQSFSNIDDLIDISKQMIKHMYNSIITTDLIDSELIAAAGSLIEVAHRNVKEYLDIYRDRLRFYDRVKFEMLQQEHKKELIQLKHDLDMKKAAANTIDVTPEGMQSFSQEKIIDMLNHMDEQ